jgi:phage baseplate assembly protein W
MSNFKLNNLKLYDVDYNKPTGTLGIKIPINKQESINEAGLFNMSYTTEEQAISNYINLLLTKSGERYMQPHFGVGLYFYLFEQSTESFRSDLESVIIDQTNIWLPYIIINNIDVYEKNENDTHSVVIKIDFKVSEAGANRLITITPVDNQMLNIEVK